MANRRRITREIREAKDRLKTWDAVNAELFDGKMNVITLRLIATTDYFPVERDIVAILCPPKPKPLDSEIAKRTLVISATLPELHGIQKRYNTRERTKNLLK